MQMRKFTATSMRDAMEMAREALGDDAIMLTNDTNNKGEITVTFAFDPGEPEFDDSYDDDHHDDYETVQHLNDNHRPFFGHQPDPQPQFTSPTPTNGHTATPPPAASAPYDPDSIAAQIGDILHYHRVPEEMIDALTESLPATEQTSDLTQLTNYIEQMLTQHFQFKPLELSDPNRPIMLVGPPGMGKTITAAKLAAKMVVENKPVRVISTDSQRAAGVEQLSAFTDILNVPLDVAHDAEDLRAILQDCKPDARIIIDSAGCNPYDFDEVKALGEFARIANIEPILVCAAGTDAGEAEEIAGVFSFLDIDRILISRTDCVRRFGSVLAVARAGGYAFCHATSSPRAMGNFYPLSAAALANLLLQYQRDRITA